MYRIRFHGRGGQGIKTASRILGTAFFHEGFEIQDAPRYGAERRGAPIFAFVRADRKPITERGVINDPDLVIVADDSLVRVAAAGVMQGLDKHAVLLINSQDLAQIWRRRLNLQSRIHVLPGCDAEPAYLGATCAGAAARLLGVIGRSALIRAIEEELDGRTAEVIDANRARALEAYERMADHENSVRQRNTSHPVEYTAPEWVDLPLEDARISAPAIHAALTSVEVKTGLWRTLRPVIDPGRCNRCWWICSSACPDKAIRVENDRPVIDYDHCKGCSICVAQCPAHAIEAIPEREAERTP